MTASTSFLTDSKYYSPIFNSAIYDGPFRIYFSQHQESLGLKVYFAIQHQHNELYKRLKEAYKESGEQIFILLYPTQDSFEMAFSNQKNSQMQIEKAEDNLVFGMLSADGDVAVNLLTSELSAMSGFTDAAPDPQQASV